MKLVSVNVGLSREIEWRGRSVRTSIWKSPKQGNDMVKRFLASGRTGFYLAVLGEGEVGAGDRIEFTEHDDHGLSVANIAALYARDSDNQALLRRAVDTPALPEGWREYFRKRLWEADG